MTVDNASELGLGAMQFVHIREAKRKLSRRTKQ